MDRTYFFIGALFVIMLMGILMGLLNDSRYKEHIKKMQNQIDELCKVTGHSELISTYLSDEEKELISHLKKDGKDVEAIKKIRELTGLELKEAKQYFDSI